MKLFGILIAVVIIGASTFIDGGDCVRVFGEFELKTGEIIYGYTHTDRTDFGNAEKNFKNFLHYTRADVKDSDTIFIAHAIDTLKSINSEGFNRSHCDFFFLACPIEETTKIGYNDWNTGKLIKKYSCETCNSKGFPYSAGGYFPILITELNSHEIKILKQNIQLNQFIAGAGYEGLTSINLISLDNKHSKKQLESIYNDLSTRFDYIKLKSKLRKLNIATFQIHSIL